jgi:hypothetical protein
MKKYLIVVALLVVIILTSCSAEPKVEQLRDPANFGGVIYIHDEVHQVGIWIHTSPTRDGIPTIAVLPDGSYKNVGKPMASDK